MSDIPPLVLGVDPGAKGGLSWVTGAGYLIETLDMPMMEVRDKLRVSAQGLRLLMAKRPVTLVVIEGVGAMPKQGVASSFAFGYGAGLVEGVAAGLGLSVEIIHAAVWKRRAEVPKDKGAARQKAIRLWPGAADRFARVKDDGRAESALFAHWVACRRDAQRISDGPKGRRDEQSLHFAAHH